MKIFKVVLIVLSSILGAAGIIVLGIYLSGGFTPKYIYPQDVFFANVSTVDDETTYTERGSTPYNEYENFKLIISTRTEEFNQDEITLSFPSNQTGSIVRYLQKVDLDETFANDSVVIYYAKNNEGEIEKFASCGQSQASYITNGNIIVPIKVRINYEFDVFVCLAPDNINDNVEISEEGEILTKLYNVGGFSQLIARSSNLNVSSTSAYINIDVPVEEIEIVGITGENISDTNILGLNEYFLRDTDDNGYCEIGTDGLFSVILDIFPARAVYKYGRNGEVVTAQYKTVVFSINSDEGLIAFSGNEGDPLVDTLSVGGVKYVQNTGISLKDIFGQDLVLTNYNFSLNNWAAEFSSIINSVEIENDILYVNIKNSNVNDYFDIEITATLKTDPLESITKVVYGYDSSLKYGQGLKTTTLGAKFVAKNNSGQSQIHAGIFKNSILEDEAIASVGASNYIGLYNLMNSDFYGMVKTSVFDVKEIAIDGFDVTDEYNQGIGTELDLTINNPTIIYANNPDSDHSLGIEMSSNISAQNKIRNILLSIQYSIDDGDTWLDATQANPLLEIGTLFNFYSGNAVVTGDALGVEQDNDLYYYNFFRPLSSSNMSYWQVTATSASEKLAEDGIDYIKIFVYYLNPNTGLVLNDDKYGPYDIDTIVNDPIETELEWNSNNDVITNDEIGAGNYNDRILIDNNDRILLENIALIKNLSSNPTYRTIRYFVYSNLSDLDGILNVQKYYGTISGVSSAGTTIYEVDPSSRYLICSSLTTYKEIEFKLTFAVVEHLPNGSPVVYTDSEDNPIYSIISLPIDENDYVIYAPIKIQKTLNITDVVYDSSKGTVEPYEIGDLRHNNTYFLQSTEKNIEISFTVDDAELFEMLANKGDIVLSAKYINGLEQCNDIYLYYENNSQPYNIALENVLTTIFATNDDNIYVNKSKFEDDDVLTITSNGNGATYKIILSTKDIEFGDENEKEARIDLTYTLYGNNIPSGYVNPKVLSTTNFFIYSGKILYAYFGTENHPVTTGDDNLIYVSKTVDNGVYTISIVNNEDVEVEFLSDEEGYLNIYLHNFGINNEYEISLSNDDKEFIQVTYNNVEQKFAINFLKTGTATITLIPEYAHSEYEPIMLTFDIDSNYDLEEKYWNEIIDTDPTTPEIDPPTFDNRIKDFITLGDQVGYKVVGESNENIIYFKDLIQVLAIKGAEAANVIDKFVFNIEYNQERTGLIYDLENTLGKIEIIYGTGDESSLIKGIKIKNNFGTDATLAVSVISANLGATFVFNINIIPFEKIVGEVSDHSGAQKPTSSEPDSTAVYSSADITISDFGVYIYDFNDYTPTTIPNLKYILYDNEETEIAAIEKVEGTFNYSLIYGEILIATLTFSDSSLEKIVFTDVAEIAKYTLAIKLADSTNDYDIQKSFVFYVSPNIEVDEESFENEESIDSNGVIYLNNQNNPILNGEQISVRFPDLLKPTMILHFGTENETKIEIDFIRSSGTTNFKPSELLKVNNVEYDSGFTVSGIKKLSEQTIILNYQGKEFTIKYWAAPDISLSENAKTVIFDGQEYIALYATQDVNNLYTWFNHDGILNENLLIRFGTLAVQSGSQKNILSLPKLYALNNTPNLIEGSNQYMVAKNNYGLIEATIIVASVNGDEAELVTFNVLIFPIEWNYIEYTNVNNDVDIKTIFDGNYSENIESGANYQISTEFISSNSTIQNKFDSYINLNNITYNLYLITQGGEVKTLNSTSDSVYIGMSGGKLCLITQPLGEDRNYRLEFIYTTTVKGITAIYTFSYYVNISKTQEIIINYPYGATSENLGIDYFDNYQNIYYSQFTDEEYVINLNSSLRNFNEEAQSFVELEVDGNYEEQNPLTKSYNKLTYSIYKVYDFYSGSEITENISNFITVTADGVVTLKNFDDKKIGYIIKAITPNGAVGYYKIISDFNNLAKVITANATVDTVEQENISSGTTISSNDIIIVNGEDISTAEDFSISKSFNLSNLTLAEPTNAIKFGLIDSSGKVLNSSNSMMFIYNNGTEQVPDYYVVTKTSANEQRAILVVYTEKDGIISEIEMVTESPYSVDLKTGLSAIYGDSPVNLLNLLYIKKDGESITTELGCQIIFNDNESYIKSNSGFNFEIEPIIITKIFNITIRIWGSSLNLDGQSIETTCIKTIDLVVQPNIGTTNGTGETTANQTATNSAGFDISDNIEDMFDKKGGEDLSTYKYKIQILAENWGTGEDIKFTNNTKILEGTQAFQLSDLKLYISPVAAIRTAIITVTLYKGTSIIEPDGDVFVATYTLTINPDTTVEINYPDHGTGANFDAEYIYWKDYISLETAIIVQPVGTVTLLTNYSGISVNGTIITATAVGEYIAKIGNDYYIITITKPESSFVYSYRKINLKSNITIGDEIAFSNNISGHIVEYVSSNPEIFDIDSTTKVITKISPVLSNIDIVITIKIDNIKRAEYKIRITNEPIFTAKFDDNKIEKNDEIADTAITPTDNLFELDFGKLVVQTKGSMLDKPFKLSVIATPKYAGRGIPSLDSVDIYGIGGTVIETVYGVDANIYLLKTSVTPTLTGISSYDILGRIDDNDIWEVVDNSGTLEISFQQSSTEPYAIKFVTTENETKYYFVTVAENLTPTYYTSTSASLTFEEIFVGDNINYDMYDYSISYANSTSEQVEVIYGTEIDQPKALLTYYYNNCQIPYETTKGDFTFKKPGDTTATTIDQFTVETISYDEIVVKVLNKFGTEVATYMYKIVYDYTLPESSFDEVTKTATEITSEKGVDYSIGEDQYEFSSVSYTIGVYQVSKLIELYAGQSYDLINDILNTRLGITALNGDPFDSFGFDSINPAQPANVYNITHGLYLSNTQYVTNKTDILGISEKTVTNPQNIDQEYKDFTILPYGAQNGGDIIHLTLTFAGETYILRIKIIPTVDIVSTESTGEFLTQFNGNDYDFDKNGTNDSMKYLLSNFVNINGILAKDLILSVLDDSDAQFVRGSENNRLIHVGDGETIENYGLVLYETKLGGVRIRFKIADKFGYIATDSSDQPLIFTLNYQNEYGLSPTIYSSSQSIFEGNSFVVAYKYEDAGVTKYKTYNITSHTWEGESTEQPSIATGNSRIILDNMSGLSPTINLTAKLEDLGEFLNKETDGSLTNLSTNFLINTKYGGATSISGETFLLTLSVAGTAGITETCRIPLNIAVNQRYQLKLKDPYDNYDKVYLRYGVNYTLNDLFELYDLLENEVPTGVGISYTGIGVQNEEGTGQYLATQAGTITQLNWLTLTPNYIDKVANGGSQDLTYTLNGIAGNEFIINLNITPKYFTLDDSGVQKYGDYGVIVKGNANSTNASLSTWEIGYVFKDYYGNIINGITLSNAENISFEKVSGTGTLTSGNITGMIPGGSVLVNVKLGGAVIGTVKVTMSRYYELLEISTSQNINTYPNQGIIVLPFTHPTGNGWGEGVYAVIAGKTGNEEPSESEPIPGGRSSFQYSVNSSYEGTGLATSLEYNETLGCYVINNVTDKSSITITVKYMGIELGTINLTGSGTTWSLTVPSP